MDLLLTPIFNMSDVMLLFFRRDPLLAVDGGELGLLGEPPLRPPHLELHYSPLVEVILVEQLLHLLQEMKKIPWRRFSSEREVTRRLSAA